MRIGIINLLKFIKRKVGILDKTAKNPFIQEDYEYNPFKPVFSRTYVWVENHNDNHEF